MICACGPTERYYLLEELLLTSEEETMSSSQKSQLAEDGERIYRERLKAQLERTHLGQFVAIEPISGDYFLGRSLSEAIGAGRKAYPDRLMYGMRIGYSSAVQFSWIPTCTVE